MTVVPPMGSPEKENFSSMGFALGVVRGIRTWRATPEGLLEGIYYKQPWLQGENQALCRKPERLNVGYFYGFMRSPLPTPAENARNDYEPPSRGHLADCRCGFYAYYDGSNDYYRPWDKDNYKYGDKNLVVGVVEGYGEVLIGTRGFRATKTRIVALHFPGNTFVDPRLILANYPDVPVFNTFEQMVAAYPCIGLEPKDE